METWWDENCHAKIDMLGENSTLVSICAPQTPHELLQG
jgi:hypothetical protein